VRLSAISSRTGSPSGVGVIESSVRSSEVVTAISGRSAVAVVLVAVVIVASYRPPAAPSVAPARSGKMAV
jgi:hypothetical protein